MFATTRDGTRLAYSIIGPAAAARRVALVHSLAMDQTFWRPVAEQLAKSNIKSLIYDCRGHGASDKPAGPYTVDQFADDLADVLDHVGWAKSAVAGCSMGGCISLAFATRHGARVSGLGLCDTTAWYGADAPASWAERADKAKAEGLAGLVAFQKTRWFGDAFREQNPQVLQDSVDVFLRNELAAYADSCRMLGTADLRARLSAIKVPTAIVVGEEDYATPVPMAQALHAAIAGSTLTILPGARHLTPLETPNRIAEELARVI